MTESGCVAFLFRAAETITVVLIVMTSIWFLTQPENQTMPANYSTQAQEQAQTARAGSGFPFLTLNDKDSVSLVMIGGCVKVADRKDPTKSQNHMHVIVTRGVEMQKDGEGKPSMATVIENPVTRRFSMNASITKQWKSAMRLHTKTGCLPVFELVPNPNRGSWESARKLKTTGANVTDAEIEILVKQAGWEDMDLPF